MNFYPALMFLVLLISGSCSKQKCVAKSKADCFCTMQYDPVCGCDAVTYGNACMAECNSITDYKEGACK